MVTINGYLAEITYDDRLQMFRGEFIGINGSADFYALDLATLKREGELSLALFLNACRKKGIDPKKPTLPVRPE